MSRVSKNLDFSSLQSVDGLIRLDRQFLSALKSDAPSLGKRLERYRAGARLRSVEVSALLLAVAPHLECFLARQFDIVDSLALSREVLGEQALVARFKEEFVKRRSRRYRAAIKRSFSELDYWLKSQLGGVEGDMELAVARLADRFLASPETSQDALDRLTEWCILAQRDVEGRAQVDAWTSFRQPQTVDHTRLVPLHQQRDGELERLTASGDALRQRDGFDLTDSRMDLRQVMDQVHYCVYCHQQEGDFCSRGFPEKKQQPELGLKVNPLGVTLTGCPLDEKISEMHLLQRDGHPLGALAVAMIDNPMIPATGHRICNDCMKACIYQKQDPVDIPQIETRILTDVLDLPWGVEIYDLLTRWNPLRRQQYLMQPYNGLRVLIAGMGPAGFTMAHHLTMEGCAVVGIDGLKIEPLPRELLTAPVKDYSVICESLSDRIVSGFGGVAEYGITVRWDKNFLKLIYLTLARRNSFRVVGGVRLGGTLTLDDAWQLGFDHVCVANGAGLPRVINMGNSLARGMRQANDFLMALQLTGAAKPDSLANLQIRLPAVVIGGGLTAIDTATEVQAYYIVQVEKILSRYEVLTKQRGDADVTMALDPESRDTLQEFLRHGRQIRTERARAEREGIEPDFISLLRDWGGVTIVYRRSINESPAYLRNHEEIVKAMEEGVYYLEGMEPVRVELDRFGHVAELVCRPRIKSEGRWISRGKEVRLPARAILVAAGTFPNTIYEGEYPGTFTIENNHFLPHIAHRHDVQPVQVAEHCKAAEFGPFTSYGKDGHRVTFVGDAHPVFHGSVVKAIASAKRSYPEIMTLLKQAADGTDDGSDAAAFLDRLEDQLRATVVSVVNDNPVVLELWVKAPLAARNFKPGQFFRLQMFESLSAKVAGTRLQIPLQTISGAGVDGDKLRLLLLRWGANAKLAAQLCPGDPIVLMGPTGAPTEVESGKTILVVAGSWGAAVMLGLGPALRAQGVRVVYFACYPHVDHLYYQDELETTADQIVWATAEGPTVQTRRAEDIAVAEQDVVELARRYARGDLKQRAAVDLKSVDHVLVMGATGLLRGLQQAMATGFRDLFREDVDIVGTVGSPMQCMLKGVCAQCLQWQVDPDSGQRTRAVFSCAMQDQPLMWIDLDNLSARQQQNRLQEHLTNLWVDHVLGSAGG
jgi:NADPH-dependent glutamate synthase beta subunit-like oxidoreductase/NAD(P)H-flavin reductase